MGEQVVDTANSETDPQRRKASNGRLLHCCCICGKLDLCGLVLLLHKAGELR